MELAQQEQNASKTRAANAAKWAAVVEDRLAPMPRRRVKARDILHQAAVVPGMNLVRDYNSPNDVAFDPEAVVDLADGNVFRLVAACKTSHEISCDAPPKLAFIVDDRWEMTIQPKQTGKTLRGLLAVPDDAVVLRDFESPWDEPIEDADQIEFADGPVFVTRGTEATEITIIVNGRPKKVTSRRLTFAQVVALAFNPVRTEPTFIYTVQYSHGPRANPEGELVEGQSVKIKDRMVFLVTETDRS